MAQTYRDVLETEYDRLETAAADPDSPVDQATVDAIREWADAVDPNTTRTAFVTDDNQIHTLEPSTIATYTPKLRLCADRGLALLEADVDAINDFMAGQHDDRGLAKTTVAVYQCAVRSFYRFHDFEIDPEGIRVFSDQSPSRHDERDMFTEQEVDALRKACDDPRDRAFLELLIYSGQRLTALQTLRIRDIDLESGVFYLNDEVDGGGLKGATARGRKRPLFGARKYVRDWLEYHPWGDDPDAPLFMGDPGNPRTATGEPMGKNTIRDRLKRIAKRAGVTKPVNPHNFRHYFVTVMKRDYDLDSDTLRMLLGVVSDSDILDTTYSHVSNEEYIEKAERQLGYREDESESPLTPDACPTCGELLEDHWRTCPACNETFAPDAKAFEDASEGMSDQLVEGLADPNTSLSADEVAAIRELLSAFDDPMGLLDAYRANQ